MEHASQKFRAQLVIQLRVPHYKSPEAIHDRRRRKILSGYFGIWSRTCFRRRNSSQEEISLEFKHDWCHLVGSVEPTSGISKSELELQNGLVVCAIKIKREYFLPFVSLLLCKFPRLHWLLLAVSLCILMERLVIRRRVVAGTSGNAVSHFF